MVVQGMVQSDETSRLMMSNNKPCPNIYGIGVGHSRPANAAQVVYPHLRMSSSLLFCLTLFPSICLPCACPFIKLSLCLYPCIHLYLYLPLSISLSLYLSTLFVRQSVLPLSPHCASTGGPLSPHCASTGGRREARLAEES